MTRDKLRKLAEAVEVTDDTPWYRAKDLAGDVRIQCAEDAAWVIAASPAVVLGLLDDLAAAEERLAAVRKLVSDWQANGNAAALSDPTAHVWHEAAHQLRRALDGRADS